MGLLLNLIMTLTAEEAEKLTALNLRGKQSAVMNLIRSHTASGQEPTPEEITQCEITPSHFYEISSVLLTKCYEVLVPSGGLPLLEYLAYKNLAIQFKQELRRQGKRLPLKKGREAEEFYLSGFELLNRFTYNLLDHSLIAEYGKLYLAAKKDAGPDDELAIKARHLQIRQLGLITDSKNPGKDSESVLAEFNELEKSAKKSSNAYLCHNVYAGLGWYWQQIGGKPERALEYLKLDVPYAAKLHGYVFRDVGIETQLRLADAHYFLGSTKEAVDSFEKTYDSLRPDHQLWKRTYFLFRYLEVLIYNEKYDKAEAILQEHFEPLFKLKPTTASATSATLLAVLYLLKGDYPKSKTYLDIGMKLNVRSNFTLYNEVRNRFVEAAYYYLVGDWHHTLSLTNRAMQYLRGNHLGLSKHIFGYYFKIIEATISFYSEGTPIWHKFEKKYKILTLPAEGLFGLLIKKIRETGKKKG